MNRLKLNKSGYPDPTAYAALVAVSKSEKARAYKPLVYIASPFAGDISANIANAKKYCKFAVRRNAIPVAPHLLYPQFMDDSDTEQRKLGLFFALVLLGKCDELWVCGDTISRGMSAEIAKATKRGMPIRYFTTECNEVSR